MLVRCEREKSRSGRYTYVWIFRKAVSLRFARLGVVDKTEVEHGAGAAEDVLDLFLGESCRKAR